jgi:molybdopterin converting factor small subunit
MQTQIPPAVRVRVLLFGSYAERLGAGALDLVLPAPATVSAAIAHLRGLPGGDQLPARPLVALNLAHVAPEAVVSPGDEIAILPPLAGG